MIFSVLCRYGDIAPTTPAGRVIACLCALSGAGTIAMLVSVLVDRYQRVFTRKRYVEPEHIDFDDYSDDDDDSTEPQDKNEFLISRDDNANVEDPQEETPPIEINRNEEEAEDRLLFPFSNLTDLSSNRISCIISYTNDDSGEEPHKLIERIRSVVSDKEFGLNDITLEVITDSSPSHLPSSHSQSRFDLNGENDISGIHLITDPVASRDGGGKNDKSAQLSSPMREGVEWTTM